LLGEVHYITSCLKKIDDRGCIFSLFIGSGFVHQVEPTLPGITSTTTSNHQHVGAV